MSSKLITDAFKQVKSHSVQARKNIKKEAVVNDAEIARKTPDLSYKRDEKQFSVDLEILRSFDLQAEYGPCIGITRLERWERANRFGLNPPKIVRDIAEKNKEDERYVECVWHDYNI